MKIKLLTTYAIGIACALTIIFEPVFIVYFITVDNWQFITIFKTIANVFVLIGIMLIIKAIVVSHSRKVGERILAVVCFMLIMAYLIFSVNNSFKDIVNGIQYYSGKCDVRRDSSRYLLDTYYINLSEKTSTSLTIKQDLYNLLLANKDICKINISLEYLENMRIVVNHNFN